MGRIESASIREKEGESNNKELESVRMRERRSVKEVVAHAEKFI